MVGASAVVTVAGAAVGITWFFVSLDARINKLEAQMQFYATSGSYIGNTPISAQGQEGSQHEANPLSETCAKLAEKATESIRSGSPLTEGQPIQEMMDRLGCFALAKKINQGR